MAEVEMEEMKRVLVDRIRYWDSVIGQLLIYCTQCEKEYYLKPQRWDGKDPCSCGNTTFRIHAKTSRKSH